jgi:bifunctional oligoribonuclease and PAP phosphatase NrnA
MLLSMTIAADRAAVAARLASAQRIILTTHLNPDGDGIGTCLALALALRALGKQVRFCCPGTPARLYGFLPGFAGVVAVEEPGAAAHAHLPGGLAEVVVSCDAGDLRRLGPVGVVVAAVRAGGGVLVNLDHHATNDRFGDLNLVDVDGESSGVVADELLARLHADLGQPWQRTAAIATCFYATIVYDTGRFMHSNTTARCLRWTAELLDAGIDAAAINRALTYTRSLNDLRIIRLGIDHLVQDQVEPRLAGIALDRAAITSVGDPDDWGDLVELPRSLQGNQIAYILREVVDRAGRRSVRASLRSNPPFVIAPVAQAFGGGGHAQAAGATLEGHDLASALAALLPLLRQRLTAP